AAEGALATRQELEALSTEFAKYKARAHTALKKATSSGAEDKRKDELIASLQSEVARLTKRVEETAANLEDLENKLAEEQEVSRAR
ncbi:unnamed protein product, partial [Ectocarpus sp. 6 AP-2014]